MGITAAHDTCRIRQCKHVLGISMGYLFCPAFPDGIPEEIASGTNLHTEPLAEQTNNIVYEKGE